ncbi:MAG TPA: hypothetical protein VGF86_13140 [Candidatus Tumulicola sp.]|jgi:hypothetical protein
MYVTDFNNSVVEIYTYPKGKHVGALTSGMLNPQGECTDAAGNVYVANTGNSNVLVYAHGGTTPVRVLDNPGQYPVGCSVNASDGDVAAADIFSPTTGVGAVTVWKSGSNQGTTYVQPAGLINCVSITYDGSGNLYVAGSDSNGPAIAYLRAGSMTWKLATIKGVSSSNLGFMQWDGRYVAFVDSQNEAIDRVRFNGRVGQVVRTVQYDGYVSTLCFFGPSGQRKLATLSFYPSVSLYQYPAGGSPFKTIPLPDVESYAALEGLAISQSS